MDFRKRSKNLLCTRIY